MDGLYARLYAMQFADQHAPAAVRRASRARSKLTEAERLATPSPQCAAAAGGVLGRSIGTSASSISTNRWSIEGAEWPRRLTRRGPAVHCRLLARAAADDADGMAAAGADVTC